MSTEYLCVPPGPATRDEARRASVDLVADKFADVLRTWLTAEEFAEMRRRNETDPEYARGACASHDFCDANMAMDHAIKAVLGRECDPGSDGDSALWNAAWERAREKHIGEFRAPGDEAGTDRPSKGPRDD